MAIELPARRGVRPEHRSSPRHSRERAPGRLDRDRFFGSLPVLALVAVAACWGVTFSVVDSSVIDTAGGSMPPADLVAWRFGLATVALLLIRRRQPMHSALRRRGVLLGMTLGTGFLLQTWAMTYTDAMMSAFLTGLLVVIAPVAGWLLFRDRPRPLTWLAVTVATAGLAMLSLRGTGFGPGELLTLAAAACWGVHLVLLARWAHPGFALELATIQTATVCVLAVATVAIGGVVSGSSPLPSMPSDGATWLPVLFLALLSTAGAMVLLSWGQSRMSATRAAVILTLEPAVAAVTAAALGGEFGLRTVAGGALLLGAMCLVEVGGRPARPPLVDERPATPLPLERT